MTKHIDIVIPTFNRSHTLNRALTSVKKQSFQDFQLWVVDDGSTDDTYTLLKKWQKHFHKGQMHILQNESNQGVSAARNRGIVAGKATWLAFLDSDDEWLPSKLQQQMEWIKHHPQHLLIHTEEIWIRNGGRVNQKKKHTKKGGRIFSHNLDMCRISPSSAIIQRAFLKSIGLFREDFPVCEDYELWLRLCAQTDTGFIETPLIIKYGGHEGQLSCKYKAMDEWRVRALSTHLNSPFVTQSEQEKLIEVLIHKCQILLKGYRKHGNFRNETEIKILYKKALNLKKTMKQSSKSKLMRLNT